MADEKKREEEKEPVKDDEENDFTQMPDAEPYPDLEPKQSAEKQVEQFNKTASTGKDSAEEN